MAATLERKVERELKRQDAQAQEQRRVEVRQRIAREEERERLAKIAEKRRKGEEAAEAAVRAELQPIVELRYAGIVVRVQLGQVDAVIRNQAEHAVARAMTMFQRNLEAQISAARRKTLGLAPVETTRPLLTLLTDELRHAIRSGACAVSKEETQ